MIPVVLGSEVDAAVAKKPMTDKMKSAKIWIAAGWMTCISQCLKTQKEDKKIAVG